MTAEFIRRGTYKIILALVLAGGVLQPAMSAEWSLDQLMQSLANVKQGRATFTEKKYIAVLERPVESSGELIYSAPDHLEKKTIKPKPENLILDGGMLTIERGNKKHVLRLRDYPEVAGFIDSIRGTLAGDRKALERSFKLSLSGDARRWTLSLAPHDQQIAQTVYGIRITGSQNNVQVIDIQQADGDRSSMTIERIFAQ